MEKRPLDMWYVRLNSTGHMGVRTMEFTFESFTPQFAAMTNLSVFLKCDRLKS